MIAAFISGVLLALAFPKFGLAWLAWVALVPFFWALRKAPGWRAALVFGLTFFLIHLFWITSLARFVGWWSYLGWFGLAAMETVFILLFVWLQHWCRRLGALEIWGVALAWTFIEWLRSQGPFGIVAGDLGYSQAGNLGLIQIASLTSVYGVSFLIALVNAVLAEVVATFRSPKRNGSLKAAATVLVMVLLIIAYGLWVMQNKPADSNYNLKIAIIQPNIDQLDKMDPAKVPAVWAVHEELTRQAWRARPEVIIWPETAIFSYLLHDPVWLPRLKALAITGRTWLVVGTPYWAGGRAYNSVVAISPAGEIISRYDKEHPVPFGEYLPFRPILFPLLKRTGYFDNDFSSAAEIKPLLINNQKIGTAVCFESTFPDLMRERAKIGPAWLLTVTNDAWFDDSAAPYLHLDCGILRAVENRKYFVQVGNTGLSALIDPYGRVLKKSRLKIREILTFEMPRQ